jgi:hypothetical protein
MEAKVNAYYVHMLERAREVDQINKGETTRDSVVKCPFCIADEDEQWFRLKNFGYMPPSTRPERAPAPHCTYCPLQSLFGIELKDLMNNCVEKGFYALRYWEDTDEEDRDYTG